MARTKIDYGIDLGTTNSAISRMENGEIVIKKTETLKDTMPSCVFINKKKMIQVGDSAYNNLRRDKLTALKNNNGDASNAFIEFKRTMGTDKTYYSSHLGKELSSEELSAEILKTLKSFIKDENVASAVITVPAAFKNNQIDATRRAAKLAGFEYIEVLQEPVAAATAYGLNNKNKDGFWLVFDFGGGTFDAALIKVEDGIMKVLDTEGDNYLGGKNLDWAIVDEIIMPYLEQNYAIDSFLEDDEKKQILRDAMKFYAEEIKIKLSFNPSHNVLSDLGDLGEDDEGEEIELDIMVNQADMERVLSPVFQKAIDLCKVLLKRNNLSGHNLSSLILVGGPTFSPVLRNMLTKQICEPDTSIDPMTVVSKGAALYASTVDLTEEIKEQTRDSLKIQLEIGHESSSVEREEFVTLKILDDKTDGEIPNKVFAKITRNDKAWSSGNVEINSIGEVVEVLLLEGKTNQFEVSLYDEKGNLFESEPNQFSIIQGLSGISSMQVLPYNYGIEIHQKLTGKDVFTQIQGLERNKSLPVTGTRNGLKTPKAIRPGMESDFITIPLYQGEHNADGTRAIYNEHVYDVRISGADLPGLLPEGSDVDLTIMIDKSQKITVSAYFPYLEYTAEIKVPEINAQVEHAFLEEKLQEARENIWEIQSNNSSSKIQRLEEKIADLEEQLNNNPNDEDTKHQVLSNLRKTLKEIDSHLGSNEWDNLERELQETYDSLKADAEKSNDPSMPNIISQYANQLNEIVRNQDMKLGKNLLEQMNSTSVQLNLFQHTLGFIAYCHHSFDEISWHDHNQARRLIDQAMQKATRGASEAEILLVVRELISLMPRDQQQAVNNSSILIG
ncbi:heat-shock protein Hsp70 [Pasteurellaceae bacterium RH1A]|nr:heat-shock protein Hsp70 [Pasteurellaceae bacterium RH1A]